MRTPFAICAVLVLAGAACAEPLEFAEWTIAVPEGTRVIEYAAVPIEARAQRIELVEELVVGGREDDPDRAFYGPSAIGVDARGRIYVVDRRNHRVQVFDAEGEFLRSFGRQGQGPGEFSSPTWIATTGSLLTIVDRSRLSVWNVDGTHERDVPTPGDSLRPRGLR